MIATSMAAGTRPRAELADEWIHQLQHSGLGEDAAIELIGRVTAPPFAVALETIDYKELPPDRQYRDTGAAHATADLWVDEAMGQQRRGSLVA